MIIHIGITYEIVTPESAEHGDYEETGWHIDKHAWRPMDLSECIRMMRERGPIEASCSPFQPYDGVWWTAYDTGERCTWNFETGGRENLNLHISGATPSTLARIHRALTN